MKETSPPPHTGSEPFTPTVGVKNRYSVLARGRFSPARLAKAPTLGSGARVDSQTALCRAGTGTIPARIHPISAGVRLNEGAYHGANRPKSARLPRFHAWIARKSCPDSPTTLPATLPARNDSTRGPKSAHYRHGAQAGRARNSLNKRNPFPLLLKTIFASMFRAATVGPWRALSVWAPPGFVPPEGSNLIGSEP